MRAAIPVVVLALFSMFPAAAQPEVVRSSALIQKVTAGEIDWAQQTFNATGAALMPSQTEEPNPDKAETKAKGNARTKALANLLIAIDSTAINYELSCKQLMSQDDALRQTIEMLARGADAKGDRKLQEAGENLMEVSVAVPMFGSLGIGSVMLRDLAQAESGSPNRSHIKIETPRPSVDYQPPKDQKGPFTGIIVEARGFQLHPALNPRLRQIDGTEVWGKLSQTSNLIALGPVIYHISIEDARSDAGKNPLIVRAIGRGGDQFMCDVVIAAADADLILDEIKTKTNLADSPIILVIDPLVE